LGDLDRSVLPPPRPTDGPSLAVRHPFVRTVSGVSPSGGPPGLDPPARGRCSMTSVFDTATVAAADRSVEHQRLHTHCKAAPRCPTRTNGAASITTPYKVRSTCSFATTQHPRRAAACHSTPLSQRRPGREVVLSGARVQCCGPPGRSSARARLRARRRHRRGAGPRRGHGSDARPTDSSCSEFRQKRPTTWVMTATPHSKARS